MHAALDSRTFEPSLLVVADDLTGAADTGVQFAARGIPTLVTLEPTAGWREAARGAEVLVASTDSRHLPVAEAAARVHDAVAWARSSGVPHVYKKIDSTLRGNVGAELEACLRASEARTLPLVPAYPAMGRTTRGGRVYVHGHPLEQTAFADDPLEPSDDGDIAAVLRRQTQVAIRVVGARSGLAATPPAGILIVDAETDDDLADAGAWLEAHGLLAVTAGAGGFAAQLADLLHLRRSPPDATEYPDRVLVVCGSVNGISLAQAEHAEAGGLATVRLGADRLMAGSPTAADDVAAAMRGRERPGGRAMMLRTAAGPGDLEACLALGAAAGLDSQATHRRVAERIGRLTAVVLDRTRAGLLVVIGGDTLRAIAYALGWRGLRPLREIVSGVPLSAVVGGRGPRLVVSKAGGFGPPDILERILEALDRGRA